MRKRGTFFFIFLPFLIVSIILFTFFNNQTARVGTGIFERIFTPLQGTMQSFRVSDTSESALQKENGRLRKQVVDQGKLQTEIAALRNQYQTTDIKTQELLPAKVIGRRGFVPGISLPSEIVIDKGTSDGVAVGEAVIYKDNAVGIVSRVSTRLAVIHLVWHPQSSLTAETLKTKAPGVIKGAGKGFMYLTSVLLSDSLEISDVVITKGDVDSSGRGFPPNLVIGRIMSVDKKPSSLFQAAVVESLFDISSLSTVFVIQN